MSAQCPTRVLDDYPAKEDSFGPHRKLANTIIDLARNEPGGKTVALQGVWGSGKSTVVGFVKEGLGKGEQGQTGDFGVFIFDAWIHQGDPLRRSFLEKLIEFLSEQPEGIGWTKQQKWQPDLDSLKGQREDLKITTKHLLPFWGYLAIIILFLLPIGYTLFGELDNPLLIGGKPLWFWGLTISFGFPLLFIIASYLFERSSGTETGRERLSSPVLYLLKKTEEINRETRTRTPDPTSIEFTAIFRRLMDLVLQEPSRRLLIVVDNLDRIDPEEALSIWSTMRIFFKHDVESTPEWLPRFWLLVPYDPSALKRLWPRGDLDGFDISDSPGEEGGYSVRPRATETELLDAFVQKTFQVTFRVPPPVLSDWKDYFVSRMKDAFPSHEPKSDFDAVYRIYRHRVISGSRFVTPRDIKLFINRLGSIHRQWCGQLEMRNQALYIACEHLILDPKDDLLREDLIGTRFENLVGDTDWRRELAAIYFNVEPNKAYQVLIRSKLEKAILEENPDTVRSLSMVVGFLPVVDHLLEEQHLDWAKHEPDHLISAARMLSTMSEAKDPSWAAIWDWLRLGVINISDWTRLEEKTGEGLVDVMRNTRESQYDETASVILTTLSSIEIDATSSGE